MSWNERQRRMLDAMGVRVWAPAAATVAPANASSAPAAAGTPIAERQVNPAPVGGFPIQAVHAEQALHAGLAASAAVANLGAAPAPAAAAAGPAAPASMAVATLRPAAAPASARPPASSKRVTATAAPAVSDPILAERAAAIATMTWDPLREAVAACTACNLCQSRRNTVFGVGHAQADWMIVGEAPGEQEDLAGEPFVGPAGQLLDQMLRAVGQSRRGPAGEGLEDDRAGDPQRRVFIANTLKCRPPRNRNPEPEEMARCEPFLRRQVELVQPKLILALGRFAVKTLLKSDEAIGKLRGRIHHYEGIPVVVSYHPAYLLRNPPDKAKSWEDLCMAVAASRSPALPAPEGPAGSAPAEPGALFP